MDREKCIIELGIKKVCSPVFGDGLARQPFCLPVHASREHPAHILTVSLDILYEFREEGEEFDQGYVRFLFLLLRIGQLLFQIINGL